MTAEAPQPDDTGEAIRQQIAETIDAAANGHWTVDDTERETKALWARIQELIRGDRRELLQRLQAQVYEYGVSDVELIERRGGVLDAVPISAIDRELQHLTGLEDKETPQ